MFYDSWGNEYNTKEEAKDGIRKICIERDDFWNDVMDFLDIPSKIAKWILDDIELHEYFINSFNEEISDYVENWSEYYFAEITCDMEDFIIEVLQEED